MPEPKRRPGTKFITMVPQGAEWIRLMPLELPNGETVIIEVTDRGVRILDDNGVRKVISARA